MASDTSAKRGRANLAAPDEFSRSLSRYLSSHRHFHPELDAFETWIPRTPFVIFFRVEPEHEVLRVLAIFHHAQDRSQFDPDTGA